MRKIVKYLFNLSGYELHHKKSVKANPRSSMQKAIEWLRAGNFEIKTILDVGASDGRWSVDCMRNYTGSHYVLFEPQPCHSAALDSLKKELGGKITLVKKAVGRKSGRTYFNIADPFGGSLSDSDTINTVEVGLTSLDDTLKETGLKGPFLLKLDTHGFEIPILEGAVNTLQDCNILIIEAYNYNIEPGSVTFWQLCEYLDKRGFRPIDLVDIMYRDYDNSFWQMDIIFIKSSWKGFEYISYK